MGGGGGPNGSGNGPSHGGGGGAPQPHGGKSLPHGAPWNRPRQSLSPGFHGGRQSWLSGPRKLPRGVPPGPRNSPCGGPSGPRCGGGPPGPPGPHCTPGVGLQGGAAFAAPDGSAMLATPNAQPIAAPATDCWSFMPSLSGVDGRPNPSARLGRHVMSEL
jgi:hypothetical protein